MRPGYDAGKKIKGKKRHILVDTQGLLIHAIVHAADIQDRDGGALVMTTMFGMYPFLLKLYGVVSLRPPVMEFWWSFKASRKRSAAQWISNSAWRGAIATCRHRAASFTVSASIWAM